MGLSSDVYGLNNIISEKKQSLIQIRREVELSSQESAKHENLTDLRGLASSQKVTGITNISTLGAVLFTNAVDQNLREKELDALKEEVVEKIKLGKLLVSREIIDSFIQEFPEEDKVLAQNILKQAFPFSNNAGVSLMTEMLTGIRSSKIDENLQILETDKLKHNSLASVLYYLVVDKSSGYYVDTLGVNKTIPQQELRKYFATDSCQHLDSNSAIILNQDLINKMKKDPNLLKQIIQADAKLLVFEGLTESSNPYSFSFDFIKEETKNLLGEIKMAYSAGLLEEVNLFDIIADIRSKSLTDQLEPLLDAQGISSSNLNVRTIKLPDAYKKFLISDDLTAYDHFSKENIPVNKDILDEILEKFQKSIIKELKNSGFEVDYPLIKQPEVKDLLEIYRDLLVTVNQADMTQALSKAYQQILGNLPDGQSKDNILFFVPKDASKNYKSLSLINLMLKEQYGFLDEQFVTVENLQNDYNRESLLNKTFVIIDDFAGSGNSIFYFAQELLKGRKLPKSEQKPYIEKMKDQNNLILVNLFATNYAKQNISALSKLPEGTVYISGDKKIGSIYEHEMFMHNYYQDPGKYGSIFGSHGFTKGAAGDGNGCAIVFYYMGPNNSVQAFANLNTLFTATDPRSSIKNLNSSGESLVNESESRLQEYENAKQATILKAARLVLQAKLGISDNKHSPSFQQ